MEKVETAERMIDIFAYTRMYGYAPTERDLLLFQQGKPTKAALLRKLGEKEEIIYRSAFNIE